MMIMNDIQQVGMIENLFFLFVALIPSNSHTTLCYNVLCTYSIMRQSQSLRIIHKLPIYNSLLLIILIITVCYVESPTLRTSSNSIKI